MCGLDDRGVSVGDSLTRSRLVRGLSTVAGIAGFTIALVLTLRDDEARRVLRELTVAAVLLILGLQAVRVVLESVRYRMAIPDRYRKVIPIWTWHWVFAVGRLLNMMVPQVGTAYRATHLRLAHGLPVSSFIGATFVITWLGNGFATLASGAIVVAESVVAGVALMVLGVLLVGGVALLTLVGTRVGAGPNSGRLSRLAAGMLEGSADLRHGNRLILMLGASLVSQVLGLITYVAVCTALGVDRPELTAAVLFAALTVASTVSLTPGGLGISEAIAGLAGGLLGIGAGVGVVIALVMRITGTVIVGTLAAVSALLGGNRPVSVPTDAR